MRELLPLVAALTTIAAVAGLCLAIVYAFTEGPIAEAELEQMRKAIRAVLPDFDNSPDDEANWVESGDYRFFLGRDAAGALVGIAFSSASREGYGGTIEVMIGILPDASIHRIEILRHLETPGLGSKIEGPDFRDQFAGSSDENRTYQVSKDSRGAPGRPPIDSITGATISSRAVTDAVRNGLEYFRAHRDEIAAGNGDEQ